MGLEMPAPRPPPEARVSATPGEIFADYGLPGFPDAIHLCGKTDLLPGAERIFWDAFGSTEPVGAMVAHYQKWLGKQGFEARHPGALWRVSGGRTLQVLAPGAPGRHQSCSTPPPPEVKSIVVVTRP
jgi:hypothetical protein